MFRNSYGGRQMTLPIKYHIGKNGPARCYAKGRANGGRECRYGAFGANHYDSLQAAQKDYEKILEKEETTVATISTSSTDLSPMKNDPLTKDLKKDIEGLSTDSLLKTLEQKDESQYWVIKDSAEEKGLSMEEYMEKYNFYPPSYQDVKQEQLLKVGDKVSELAEKYGAPTDEEIESTIKKSLENLEKEIEEKRDRYRDIHLERQDFIQDKIQEYKNNGVEFPSVLTPWEYLGAVEPSLKEEYENLKKEEDKAWRDYSSTAKGDSPDRKEAAKKLFTERSEKYREALEAAGVEFTGEGEVKYREKSQRKAMKAMEEAVGFYPKSWVDKSNKEEPFIIKMSKKRAHYTHSATQRSHKVVPNVSVRSFPKGWEPNPKDPQYYGAYKIEGDTHTTLDKNGEKVFEQSCPIREGEQAWVVPVNEFFYPREYNPKPRGRGWKEVEIEEERTVWVEGKGTRQEVTARKVWVRSKNRQVATYTQGVPEITINEDKSGYTHKAPGTSTAIHEFAHRVGHVHPEILRAEQNFLNSRTIGEEEKLIGGYKDEYGYRDNFTNHYMGKVYKSGDREILSMGMEALFSGTNGGFTNAFQHKRDPEYKSFILGLLASSVND